MLARIITYMPCIGIYYRAIGQSRIQNVCEWTKINRDTNNKKRREKDGERERAMKSENMRLCLSLSVYVVCTFVGFVNRQKKRIRRLPGHIPNVLLYVLLHALWPLSTRVSHFQMLSIDKCLIRKKSINKLNDYVRTGTKYVNQSCGQSLLKTKYTKAVNETK